MPGGYCGGDGGGGDDGGGGGGGGGGGAAAPSWWAGAADFTPLGNFSAWHAAGYDAGSVVVTGDPGFNDAARADFCARPAAARSAALDAIGFEDLDAEICAC